jgi:hypothetical protein
MDDDGYIGLVHALSAVEGVTAVLDALSERVDAPEVRACVAALERVAETLGDVVDEAPQGGADLVHATLRTTSDNFG